jgi:hypothetical protein
MGPAVRVAKLYESTRHLEGQVDRNEVQDFVA